MKNSKTKRIVIMGVVLFLIAFAYLTGWQRSKDDVNQNTQKPTAENCIADSCLKVKGLKYPVATLPDDHVLALRTAIDNEYRARASYLAVIKRFGPVKPFNMIIRTQEQNVSILKALFDKYGIEVPADQYGNIAIEGSIEKNCQLNADTNRLYSKVYQDELLPAVQNYEDIKTVLHRLIQSRENNFLPAFQQCV